MKKPILSEKELQILNSMSLHWDEADKREQPHHVFIHELQNVQNVVSSRKIIAMISYFLKSNTNG